MSTVRIHPATTTMQALRREANKHDTTVSALVAALVRTVANQDLFDAVLDGIKVDAGATRLNRDGWTPDRINALITLTEEGWSNKSIAGKLGISRSAVIGKQHRLGLKSRQPESVN